MDHYRTLGTQLFYRSLDFVRDNPGKPVPEETFTHSHLSQSSIIPYLLPPSINLIFKFSIKTIDIMRI